MTDTEYIAYRIDKLSNTVSIPEYESSKLSKFTVTLSSTTYTTDTSEWKETPTKESVILVNLDNNIKPSTSLKYRVTATFTIDEDEYTYHLIPVNHTAEFYTYGLKPNECIGNYLHPGKNIVGIKITCYYLNESLYTDTKVIETSEIELGIYKQNVLRHYSDDIDRFFECLNGGIS